MTETLCDDRKRKIPKHKHLTRIINAISKSHLKELSKILMKIYENNLPTKETICHKIEIINEIRSVYPESEVFAFGSCENGFSTIDSDIDISVNVSQLSFNIMNRNVLKKHIDEIERLLKNSGLYSNIRSIFETRCPVLKLTRKDDMKADITINNFFALENTKMIRCYTELNPMVSKLGIIIKYMTKTFKIVENKGYPSSYAYNIMLIHFLQQRNLLPVLQELYGKNESKPNKFIEGYDFWYQSDKKLIERFWDSPHFQPSISQLPKNDSSLELSELWINFLKYYVTEFEFKDYVITIKQSKMLLKSDKKWEESFMAIEDPFIINQNLGYRVTNLKFEKIIKCFKDILLVKGDLSDISLSKNLDSDLNSVPTNIQDSGTNHIKDNIPYGSENRVKISRPVDKCCEQSSSNQFLG